MDTLVPKKVQALEATLTLLSCLVTSRVHPLLDGCTLNVYNLLNSRLQKVESLVGERVKEWTRRGVTHAEFARAPSSYEPNENAGIISVQVSRIPAWPLLCLCTWR